MLAERPLLAALAVSLAAHLAILVATGRLWSAVPDEIGFPIEASLAPLVESRQAPVAPAIQADASSPSVEAQPEPPVPPLPLPAPEPPAAPPAAPPSVQPVPEPLVPSVEAPPVPTPAPVVEAKPEVRIEPTLEARPARPALRSLPGRVEIRYAVQYGDAAFTAGEARYLWQSQNGRYSLVSTLEAKGLASLFVSGRITQVSEGEVNAGGLQPEQYWEHKGERRQDAARFLWAQNQLVLSGNRGSVALIPQAQDLLSFPFQLAATARETESEFSLAVSNGRKLQTYRFKFIGEERLNLPGRSVEALHLQGGREGAGTLDVWLDRNTAYLPVQVRTLDQKGKQITLVAEEVAVR